MSKYILRIDDVGQSLDQKELDTGLEYFLMWFKEGGWTDEPMYLGVVPHQLTEREIAALDLLEKKTGCEVCMHGWDHANAILIEDEIMLAHKVLPDARCVIPPHNKYDNRTFNGMEMVADDLRQPVYLLGGFPGEHHSYGMRPTSIGKVVHLSAVWDLYARSYQVASFLQENKEEAPTEWPQVITLHHRWDFGSLSGVRQLMELLKGKLVRLEDTLRYVR